MFFFFRSKGRIASGLLHAKAGILRAGANILAQKANALDKVAQAIPGAKAAIINQLQGLNKDKGGLGGFGIGGMFIYINSRIIKAVSLSILIQCC